MGFTAKRRLNGTAFETTKAKEFRERKRSGVCARARVDPCESTPLNRFGVPPEYQLSTLRARLSTRQSIPSNTEQPLSARGIEEYSTERPEYSESTP